MGSCSGCCLLVAHALVLAQQALCPFLVRKPWWLLPAHGPCQCGLVGPSTAKNGQAPFPSLSTLGLNRSAAGAGNKASKKLGWWGEIWARRSWEAVQPGDKPSAPPLPEKPPETTLAVTDQQSCHFSCGRGGIGYQEIYCL